MKSFLAYCIFVLEASEEAGAERLNMPVNPDGEVQSSATQIEVKTFLLFVHKYTVVYIELLI